MWKLFLDDERYSVDDDFMVIRSCKEAIKYIGINGLPEYISFDHDLGNEDTGYDFTQWLVEYHLSNNIQWNINYYVHSQNPIGKNNIINLIENFKRFQNSN